MVCQHCGSEHVQKAGKNRNGSQRFQCLDCKKKFTNGPARPRPLGTMRLPLDKAAYCLRMLLEGTSIRSCQRLTGVDRNTLCDLILSVGERCKAFLAERLQSVPVADVQV